jgi:hypothetical protein
MFFLVIARRAKPDVAIPRIFRELSWRKIVISVEKAR